MPPGASREGRSVGRQMHADQLALQQLALQQLALQQRALQQRALQQELQGLVDLAQAPKSNQRSFDCFVEWGVRLLPEHGDKARVIHAQRNTP